MPIYLKQKITKKTDALTASEIKEQILAAAREAREAGRQDEVVIEFPVGKFPFTETLTLSREENPELSSVTITFRGAVRDMSEISSLYRLEGTRFIRAEGTPYFTYQMDKDENGNYPKFHNVFFNFNEAKRQTTEKWKNPVAFTEAQRAGTEELSGIYAPIEIAKAMAAGPIGGAELMFFLEWEFASMHITGVDLESTLTGEDGKEYALLLIEREELKFFATHNHNNRSTKGRELYVRNCPALLSEDNSYAYDAKAGILYFDPKDKVNMRWHAIEIPLLDTLFHLVGMQNVTFEGLTLRGVSSGYVCDNLYYSGQANNIKPIGRLRTAAILAEGSDSLTVKNCLFKEMGTNGIQVCDFSVRTTVCDSVFKDIGMCAVSIGNPSWKWEDPKNRTFTVHIENNYFGHIAYDYPSAPCLYIGQVDGLKILHNTISDCAYSAVSAGWNWNPVSYELGEKINIRDAEIAYNYFHNYMQLLKDGGAVYVLGSNCHHDSRSDRFNLLHDNFAIIDALDLAYGKYGYYCDGSASNWDVYHSVVINTAGMPIFSQPHPNALSYHNHFTDIYSNTPRHISTHIPSRDIITQEYHLLEADAETFLSAYPEAVKIRDAAGCSLVI